MESLNLPFQVPCSGAIALVCRRQKSVLASPIVGAIRLSCILQENGFSVLPLASTLASTAPTSNQLVRALQMNAKFAIFLDADNDGSLDSLADFQKILQNKISLDSIEEIQISSALCGCKMFNIKNLESGEQHENVGWTRVTQILSEANIRDSCKLL